MCLAVPLKITNIEGMKAVAEVEGVKRNIRIDFIDNAMVGDYVIVHAGFAIEKLNQEQAEENLRLIKEVADALESI